jgi:hypothetical protein
MESASKTFESVSKSVKSLTKQQWFFPLVLVIIVVLLAVHHARTEMFGPIDTDPQYTGFGIFPKAIAQLFIGKELISANPQADAIPTYYNDSKFNTSGMLDKDSTEGWQLGHSM